MYGTERYPELPDMRKHLAKVPSSSEMVKELEQEFKVIEAISHK